MEAVITITVDVENEKGAAAARDTAAAYLDDAGVAVVSWGSALTGDKKFTVWGVDVKSGETFAEIVDAPSEAAAQNQVESEYRVVAHVASTEPSRDEGPGVESE